MIEVTVAAIMAFISTNVDDVFILLTLFTLTSNFTARNIFIGQYLGFITLVIISIVGSVIGLLIPEHYVGLLGFFPIYLGVRKIFENLKGGAEMDDEVIHTRTSRFGSGIIHPQTLSVAAITVANGGDNIGIYVPYFVTLSLPKLIYTICIFLILMFGLIRLAKYLTQHPVVLRLLKRYNHILFPLVLVALGIYILIVSGSCRLIWSWKDHL